MASLSTHTLYCTTLLTAKTATGAGSAINLPGATKTFQATGRTTNGAGTVSVDVEGSVDGSAWSRIGTITVTLSTTDAGDSFTSDCRYAMYRGNVTAISGTGANVDLKAGH